MVLFGLKLIKIAAVGVLLLGFLAAGIVVTPFVAAQTLRSGQVRTFGRDMSFGSEIGASLRNVDDADVKREKLSSATGAVVEDVRSDGPAAKAGFRAGDIVVSFDGETVRSARQLARLIEETPDGRAVNATVVRGGEKVTLKVTPEATNLSTTLGRALQPLRNMGSTFRMPERLTMNIPPITRDRSMTGGIGGAGGVLIRGRGRLGATVEDLTEQLGDYFGTKDGVLVTGVDADTPAKTAGLKAGDIIVKIDGQTVRDTTDLRRQIARADGESTLTILRDHKEITLKVKL